MSNDSAGYSLPQGAMSARRAPLLAAAVLALLGSGQALASSTSVTLHQVNEQGQSDRVGQITIEETEHGLLFTPDLHKLPEGMHGFHVHEHGSCDPAEDDGDMAAAMAAGGHFDPEGTGEHLGPYGDGHLGDLPALYVNEDGRADMPVLAPRLERIEQIAGRTLMLHVGGDNYSDHPEPLGGGGERLACGVI